VYTHIPVYEDGTECSEMSGYILQTPGNYPEESIQQDVVYYTVRLPNKTHGTE